MVFYTLRLDEINQGMNIDRKIQELNPEGLMLRSQEHEEHPEKEAKT